MSLSSTSSHILYKEGQTQRYRSANLKVWLAELWSDFSVSKAIIGPMTANDQNFQRVG